MFYNKVIINLLVYFDFFGFFVCKKLGLYVFYFFFLVYMQSRIWMEFYKNVDYVCFIYGFIMYGFVDVGNFVLFYFNENDVISIRFYVLINIIFYGIFDQIYMIFIIVFLNLDINGKIFYIYSLYYDFLFYIKV